MWYGEGKLKINMVNKEPFELDLSKPICAKRCSGDVFLLLPQIEQDNGYSIVGYNWLNMSNGVYNSCMFFANVEVALEVYEDCEIFNGDIEIVSTEFVSKEDDGEET